MSNGMKIFTVKPVLPERLEPLMKIAYNLWWSWNPEAIELFRRIDRVLWEEVNHNPVKLLSIVSQERLNELLHSESFLDHMDRVYKELNDYMGSEGWFEGAHGHEKNRVRFVYFSMEFGIHESLPIYSGGLGILAGDHLKSASDLGIPLAGVGLLYYHGYFQQYLNEEGWQQEVYPQNDFHTMPVMLVKDKNGEPIKIDIDIKGTKVYAQIWKIQVGRVPLYLLDTNIKENPDWARQITSQLYGGDLHMRIMQEILLGIGGARAIRALGLEPRVYHMNEGHSAFLTLENIRYYMQKFNLSFNEAKELTIASSVFTTHTPVPAGNDRFPPEMIYEYFENYVKELGISINDMLALGRENPDDPQEFFCMTVLALKLSSHSNGVSRLHGKVSRNMWKNIWKGLPVDEVPIEHITNGIHIPTWLSDEMTILYDRYLGTRWRSEPYDLSLWERVNLIPNSELWRTHERLRERLVAFVRRRLKKQLERRGAPKSEIEQADGVLSSEALTIGFARRFATYKRAILIFRDVERLKKILLNKERPVQLIFAGKAHPRDNEGKEFIKRIIQVIKENPELRNRIVFIEDYDLDVARYMVQGVDVWLNNPRRPLEASGTSGMKVAPNGGLNLSILDGWWCEGYNTENGWAIGSGEEYDDPELQDEIESRLLYEILEKEVVPTFYNRGEDGLPLKWIIMMKNAMRTISPQFNTNRMVSEYVERFYLSSEKKFSSLIKNSAQKAKELSNIKRILIENWGSIIIKNVNVYKKNNDEELKVGDELSIDVEIELRSESDIKKYIRVDAYYGILDNYDNIIDPEIEKLDLVEDNGNYLKFSKTIILKHSGRIGFKIRVLPDDSYITEKYIPGLIIWN